MFVSCLPLDRIKGDIMQKIKLDLEALAVDSFGTDAEGSEVRGTVQANGALGMVSVRLTCYTCGGSTCDETGSPCVAC
jgi:hypothetical protein